MPDSRTVKAPGRGRKVVFSSAPIVRIDGWAVTETHRTAKAVKLRIIDTGVETWFPLAGLEESRPGWVLTKSWLLGSLSDEQREFFNLPKKAS